MSSRMSLLAALLFAGFLTLTLSPWLIKAITGRRLGTILRVLVQLTLEFPDGFLQFFNGFIQGCVGLCKRPDEGGNGYTGAVKPPVRRTGNRKSVPEETDIYAAEPPSRR